MSLLRTKRKSQDLRAESKRQGKLPVESFASEQQQNNAAQLSKTAPASTDADNQNDKTLPTSQAQLPRAPEGLNV